jgi:hypothetical protein
MANPTKVFQTNINRKDTNYLLYFNLIVAFLGSLFLAWNDVNAGVVYTLMFVGGMAVIFLTMLVLKDDNTLKPITEYVKIPFETSLPLAAAFYLVGQLVPILVKLLLKLIGVAIDVVSFSIPLFGADISNVQSFSAAELAASPPWKVFMIMFVSGNTETYTWGFPLVFAGILIGVFTLKLINDGKDLGFISKKVFVLCMAFGLCAGTFILSHVLNDNYTKVIMFVIAGLFLIVSNASMYLGGVFMSFWMGYHQTNNLLWLIYDPKGLGAAATAGAFVSIFGFIFLIYEVLLIYYVLRHRKRLAKEIGQWFNS